MHFHEINIHLKNIGDFKYDENIVVSGNWFLIYILRLTTFWFYT